MPDIIDRGGVQIKTLNEIISDLDTGMRAIYGDDINLDQNSPDGQMLNIVAQAALDLRELALGIYNSMNPDRAIGALLDERVVYNNIFRKGGTYTIVPIDITTDRTLTLAGLDAKFNDIDGTGYTVQDDAGNKFILVDTTEVTAGVTTLNFRAQQIGLVETTVATITNPVTIVLGVTNINNSAGALEVGQNEETDVELRYRRQKSVALAATGYLNGLLGALLNLEGVTDARVYENVTNVTDVYGIPAHGIWAIVEGGANTDIGETIYDRKSYGANMKGAVDVPITTASGNIFHALFDRPVANNLYVRFDIKRTVPDSIVDEPGIKEYIVETQTYDINEFADTASLTAVAQAAIIATGGQAVPINMEISLDGVTWADYLTPATLAGQFVLDTSRITTTVVV